MGPLQPKLKAEANLVFKFLFKMAELQSKHDDNARQLTEFANLKGRLGSDNAETIKQIEAAESQINMLTRLKQQLTSQVEEAKRTSEDEIKVVQFVL